MIVHRASIPTYNNSPSLHVAACSYARWSDQHLLDISISTSLDGASSSAVSSVGEQGHSGKQTILRAGTAFESGRICPSRYFLTAVKKILAVQVVRGTFQFGRGYVRLSCSLFRNQFRWFSSTTLSNFIVRPSVTLCPARANSECCR